MASVLRFDDWETTLGTGVVSTDGSGNVAVGGSSPSYKLDVTGDINASGALRIGGTAVGDVQTYTPTWSVPAGTTPTIGNGSLTGKYAVMNNWCVGSLRLALGSTSSISGTSEWRFSFPVTPVNISNYDTLGAALAVDVGTAGHRGTAFFIANTIGVYGSDVANTVGSTTPFTFSPASGDYVTISFAYEVA